MCGECSFRSRRTFVRAFSRSLSHDTKVVFITEILASPRYTIFLVHRKDIAFLIGAAGIKSETLVVIVPTPALRVVG